MKDMYDELFDRIPHENKYILEPKEIADYILELERKNKELQQKVNLLEDNRLFLNKKIGQAIRSLKEECTLLEEWHYDGYDPQLEIIIDLLEAQE